MKQAIRVKILILGESAVGKSSLLTQYVDQKFTNGHMPTIGVEYKQKLVELEDKSLLKVQIWDTAGTERFRTITPMYYRNVDGVLLVYDITDAKSFETINYWVEELNEKSDVANIQLLLVGNKLDLTNKRQISYESGNQVAEKLGILYCQTSAKTYDSTKTAFDALIQKILKRKKKDVQMSTAIKISNQNATKKKKKKDECCG